MEQARGLRTRKLRHKGRAHDSGLAGHCQKKRSEDKQGSQNELTHQSVPNDSSLRKKLHRKHNLACGISLRTAATARHLSHENEKKPSRRRLLICAMPVTEQFSVTRLRKQSLPGRARQRDARCCRHCKTHQQNLWFSRCMSHFLAREWSKVSSPPKASSHWDLSPLWPTSTTLIRATLRDA